MYILKKITFYSFIVLSICAATWAYFKLKQKKQPEVSVISHIPNNAFCVIECKNYSDIVSQLTHQNLIWNKLLTNQEIKVAQANLHVLDSLASAYEDLKDILTDNPIYWSFLKTSQATQHLVQFKLKEKDNESFFLDFFQKTFQKDNSVESFLLYTFKIDNQKWYIALEGGIVYISSNSLDLQKAITLDSKESIANDSDYADFLKMNANQSAHLYFNHRLYSFFSKDLLSRNSDLAIDIQLNQINLNGYSSIDSSSFLNTLRNQEANRMSLFKQLPSNPVFVKAVTLSDVKMFYNQLESYDIHKYSLSKQKGWDLLNDSAMYSIQNEFFENIDHEITSGQYMLNEELQEILIIQIKDIEKINPFIKLIADSVIKTNALEKIKIKQKFGSLFSIFNGLASYSYAFINDNQFVLATNQQVAALYETSISNGDILEKNNRFISYADDNLMQEANYLYYENVDLIKQNNLTSFFQSDELIQTEKAISYSSFVAKNYKNYLQIRINVTHANNQSSDKNNANTLWTFLADSALTTSVFMFTNHNTKENELCFQDQEKQLYLVSSTGNLLWKKRLDEFVQSHIYVVDIFKNGKYQLLFNTENYLHLIDRNGNEVDGYPKKMPSKITSNITLLDYDNTKDYRIFIACADKKIYNFSIFGIMTEGFIPVKTDAEVKLPIYYTKLGQSDYLTTVDVLGKIYTFSRKGLGRIDFKNKTITQLSNLYISQGSDISNTKLVYIDDLNNALHKISFADKKEVIKIGDDLSGYQTSFDLVDDDTQPDIVAFGDGGLYGYDLFSNKLFEIFNTTALYDDAHIISTSSRNLIIAFDRAGQKLDVYTIDGKFLYAIPSVSKKPLISQLYNNGSYYLVFINDNQVNCSKLE